MKTERVQIRLEPTMLEELDKWRRAQAVYGVELSRGAAIRYLVSLGMTMRPNAVPRDMNHRDRRAT